MAVFRIQNQVPDAYNRNSRDFQLLCNTFDCMYGAVKYDIDSIRDVTDTTLCNDNLLSKLQTKLGFFTNITMNTETQRLILKAFPYLIKHKGSINGIKQAIHIYLKTQNIIGTVDVKVKNQKNKRFDGTNIMDSIYVVNIGLHVKLMDITILTELLKYILPAGYGVNYSLIKESKVPFVKAYDKIKNSIDILFVTQATNDAIRNDSFITDGYHDLPINAVSTTGIPLAEIANDIDADTLVVRSTLEDRVSTDITTIPHHYQDYEDVEGKPNNLIIKSDINDDIKGET